MANFVDIQLKEFMYRTLVTCGAAVLLSACASPANDITPAYVSPLIYNGYDCSQLAAEDQRLAVRASQLGARIDQAAQNDKILVGSSVLLFYPIFFIGGNKERETEFARIKGEASALQQAAIAKKCESLVAPAPSIAAASQPQAK